MTDEQEAFLWAMPPGGLVEMCDHLAELCQGLMNLVIAPAPNNAGFLVRLPHIEGGYLDGSRTPDGLHWFICREQAEGAVEYAALKTLSEKRAHP